MNTSSVPFDNTSDDSINITIVITQAGKKEKNEDFHWEHKVHNSGRFYSHNLWWGSLSLRLDDYQSMLTRIWQQNHLQNVKNISAAENICWSHRRPLSRGGSCWRRDRCGGTCSSDSDKYTFIHGSTFCIRAANDPSDLKITEKGSTRASPGWKRLLALSHWRHY